MLLYNCTLKNRTSSSLWINNNAYGLQYLVPDILGRPFSAAERTKVHRALDNFMNESDRKRIDSVMNKISGIKSIDDIAAVDYGMSLAIAGVLCCETKNESADNPKSNLQLSEKTKGEESQLAQSKPSLVGVTLKHGVKVAELDKLLLKPTMLSLQNFRDEGGSLALYELLQKCKYPSYKMFGQTRKLAEKMSLITDVTQPLREMR